MTSERLSLPRFRALPRTEQVAAALAPSRPVPVGLAIRLTVTLGRPRTCVLGVVAFLLGYARIAEPGGWFVVLGTALTIIAGLVANLANAYTDVEEDSANLPSRIWLVARLGHRRLYWITAGLALAALALAVPQGWEFVAFVVVGLVLVYQYSFPPLRLKAHPLLGLVGFAWAVIGPFLIGYFGALGSVRMPDAATLAVLGFLLLWTMAKGLVKNVPDYAGDRAAGLRTSATIFPSRRAAATTAAWATVLAYLALPLLVLADALPTQVALAIVWVVPAGWQGLRLVRAADPRVANTVLRQDMLLSLAFLTTVLLLAYPGVTVLVTVLACLAVVLLSDALALDSRHDPEEPGGPR
ncbi:hypothetical protein E0H26_09720 [Micromonospora zingiberis]|uniref:Ubiquinone biosynthesis protein UbiA n=1 Tax=Micromonospora zingiberis TaxID=2053011 RepID=A0A4R0GMK2_9ACTN|nr:UbiA family prenyltransferase [Micromonospora zingiberis]TCB97872.1 hypothetical protein E0H26_09720 [Micromonospora zingiberis]